MGQEGTAVKLYWMDADELEDPTRFEEGYSRMSRERREKIDAYRFDKGKRLSLGAGLLLDAGLSDYGLREASVKFAQGDNGKPYLPEYPDIHFNLSHSANRVFAIFGDVPVGCDIEYMKKVNLNMAKRFFCKGEYEYLLSHQGQEEQKVAFYRLWTLKESFIKATGRGLSLPLNQFEFRFCPDGEVHVRQEAEKGDFFFREYGMGEYRAAVCLNGRRDIGGMRKISI